LLSEGNEFGGKSAQLKASRILQNCISGKGDTMSPFSEGYNSHKRRNLGAYAFFSISPEYLVCPVEVAKKHLTLGLTLKFPY
jgi:hypothetical protein